MDLKNYLANSDTTKAAFARSIGVSAALLHQWIEQIRPVAPQHCPQIEKQTAGAVTRAELRPDDWHLIWPELDVDQQRRATDPIPEAGHGGRQPACPHNILDTVPVRAVITPTPTGEKQ
jgi:DNA-binding transcriptional regulator YdaS (Cro superfamily)